MRRILKLLAPERLVPERHRIGELPSIGTAYKTVIDIAWPSVLEMVMISTISIVDTIMVGGLGPYAISAVGITSQPMYLFMALFFAKNVGVTAVIARRRGQGDRESANVCLRQAICITAIGSLILSAVAIIFARQILVFAGAGADIIDPAERFFKIVMSGFFFTNMSANISAAQRGCGFSKISMRINLSANIVNTVLNYVLIYGKFGFPRLEVAGSGYATVIGTMVGCVVAFASLRSPEGFLHLSKGQSWRFNKEMLSSIWFISKSAALEQVAIRVGLFTYAKIVASLGTEAFASYQIVSQILGISFNFGDGLGATATSLVGQSLGKLRADLAMLYGKICQRMGAITSAGLMLIFVVFRYQLVGMFTNDVSLIELTAPMMLIVAAGMPMQISQPIYGGSLRGAGDVKFVAYTMWLSIAIIRPGVAAAMIYGLNVGVAGAWISFIVDQYLRGTLLAKRFAGNRWADIKI